jgi:diguanylate cyclase (GGDEF)-like protein
MSARVANFRNRVTRRVFATFALAAVVPALATSVIAYYTVEQLLFDKSFAQLRSESKNYALSVSQRLVLARDLFEESVTRLPGETRNRDTTIFSGYGPADSRAQEESHATEAWKADAANGIELEIREIDDHSSVWLSHGRTRADRVTAQVNSEFLWGSSALFPATMSFCVLDQNHAIVFCPDPPGIRVLDLWRQSITESSVGNLTWTENGAALMVGYFTVPLHYEFGQGSFSVAAIQAADDAMAPMAGFRKIFPPAIGLSVLLALWISLYQVSRRLRPLDVLTKATNAIAAGDFSTDVKLDTNDEFQSLAISLNKMRLDLHRQISTLQALSELDQNILSTNEVQTVIEGILRSMLKLFDCQCVTITIIDNDAADMAKVLWTTNGETIDVARIEFPENHSQTERNDPIRMSHAEADAAHFLPPGNAVGGAFLVAPIFRHEQLVGVISLAYADSESRDIVQVQPVKEFAARLAVALQTIDRAEELYRRAHYDSLTALPNRQLFKDRLDRAIAHAKTHDQMSALLFIDLDNFKSVNDSEGHAVGDKLLRLAAQRLRRCISRIDTIARLGGDEFTVILSDIESPNDALKASERIISTLSDSFQIDTIEHFLSASIGITMIPADGDSVDELLRNSDIAMYRAKELGRSRSIFFEEQMNKDAEHRVSLAADLKHAIRRNELVLFYQPKVELETQRMPGAEALLRWSHPTRGMLMPDTFISIAEETGMILEIGEWVIAEAARQLADWKQRGVLETLALNVSYRQLRDADVVKSATDALHANKLGPGDLEFEITESMLAEDMSGTVSTLRQLRDKGVRIAIDDFGTGYSAFSYLTELSFDTLKIDKAFLADIPASIERTAVLAGIVQIGTMLGKQVVAEGVETPEQAVVLSRHGCGYAQGYLYSPALPADEFEAFVSRRTTLKLA